MAAAMANVLVLFAHPALEKSQVNRRMLEALPTLDQLVVHDLYELYPDFYIDVEREQQLLSASDIVVLHFPFYWYSVPALLKQWIDLVLEHGWAYGAKGRALEGKQWILVMSTGGGADDYSERGTHHASMRQLLLPLELTAKLCRMEFLPPVVAHATHSKPPEQVAANLANYRLWMTALVRGQLDMGEWRKHALIQLEDLPQILTASALQNQPLETTEEISDAW